MARARRGAGYATSSVGKRLATTAAVHARREVAEPRPRDGAARAMARQRQTRTETSARTLKIVRDGIAGSLATSSPTPETTGRDQ